MGLASAMNEGTGTALGKCDVVSTRLDHGPVQEVVDVLGLDLGISVQQPS